MPRDETALLNGRATARSYGAVRNPTDPEAQNGPLAGDKLDDIDLRPLAETVLRHLQAQRNSSGAGLQVTGPDGAYLPILLYATYRNSRSLVPPRISSRERLNMQRQAAEIDIALHTMINAYLDAGMRLVREATSDGAGDEAELGQARLVESDEGGAPEPEIEIEVEEMIWRRWTFGDAQLSVVDLLLPPYSAQPTPFLSHPLLVHSLDNAWRYGPPSSAEYPESRFGRVRNTLLSYITPRRSHLLSLASHVILFLLTLLLALEPRRWIHPYKQQSRHPHFWEGVYIAWAYSSIFDGFHSRLRTVFLLPTTCVPILAYLDSAWAFSILAFSLLPLTLLLILPHSPSLALLDPDYVPLSTLVVHLSTRGLKSARFLVPLCVAVFVIFAWALNGDMFRGFFVLPALPAFTGLFNWTDSTVHAYVRDPSDIVAEAKPTYDDIPVEPGLAPFETRLMLFLTLLTLLFLSTAVTLVRILTPAYHHPPSHPGTARSAEANDRWVTDYGPAIARSARQRWAHAVRTDIVRKEIVAPLNYLVEFVLPLDSILFVVSWLPARWMSPRAQRWRYTLQAWRDNMWAFIMGPLCFPLFLVDRIVSGRDV